MSSWVAVFSQSPVNNAPYDGDRLPEQIWHWPTGHGFKRGCAICASAITSEPRGLPPLAGDSFGMNEAHMRIAEIDWPLFWQALRQQDPTVRERWLARWVFADDTVRLSRQSGREKKR